MQNLTLAQGYLFSRDSKAVRLQPSSAPGDHLCMDALYLPLWCRDKKIKLLHHTSP